LNTELSTPSITAFLAPSCTSLFIQLTHSLSISLRMPQLKKDYCRKIIHFVLAARKCNNYIFSKMLKRLHDQCSLIGLDSVDLRKIVEKSGSIMTFCGAKTIYRHRNSRIINAANLNICRNTAHPFSKERIQKRNWHCFKKNCKISLTSNHYHTLS
jgi:hypothetical protein